VCFATFKLKQTTLYTGLYTWEGLSTEYMQRSPKIVLSVGNKKWVLQKILKGRDPDLVDADSLIGFLPNELQLYNKLNILIYTSSIRTNSGSGGGQCSSGGEIFLNFLNVTTIKPRIVPSILIGSCDSSIELADQNISEGRVGEISAEGKKLLLHFMNYKTMTGSPYATVASDFKNLIFR
jgi:hypothetical protein